jgi:hypothetical protein
MRKRPGCRTIAVAGAILATAALPAAAADVLGRLFTTPQQRAQLEELRHAEEAPKEIELADVELIPEETAGPEAAPVDAVRVRGLVTRGQGRSTAWINDGNTYTGDLSLEYLHVRPTDIRENQVQLGMPDGRTTVTLKVGTTYDPATEQVRDITEAAAPQPVGRATGSGQRGR